MTIGRVLLAVDDSPAAMRAADLALELARTWGAEIRIVTVVRDQARDPLLGTSAPARATRLDQGGATILQHVATRARALGLTVDAVHCIGEPFEQILEQARSHAVDMIVLGRSDRRGPSSPYVGSVTAHVLEFAECPVLVVPGPREIRGAEAR